jgi:hypothetical protein
MLPFFLLFLFKTKQLFFRDFLLFLFEVFGLKQYRNYFHNMHSEFDRIIWGETLTLNAVAAHMFSGTPQGGICRLYYCQTFQSCW